MRRSRSGLGGAACDRPGKQRTGDRYIHALHRHRLLPFKQSAHESSNRGRHYTHRGLPELCRCAAEHHRQLAATRTRKTGSSSYFARRPRPVEQSSSSGSCRLGKEFVDLNDASGRFALGGPARCADSRILCFHRLTAGAVAAQKRPGGPAARKCPRGFILSIRARHELALVNGRTGSRRRESLGRLETPGCRRASASSANRFGGEHPRGAHSLSD